LYEAFPQDPTDTRPFWLGGFNERRWQRDSHGFVLNWKSTPFSIDDTPFEWVWDADSAAKFWVREFEYEKSAFAELAGGLAVLTSGDAVDDTQLLAVSRAPLRERPALAVLDEPEVPAWLCLVSADGFSGSRRTRVGRAGDLNLAVGRHSRRGIERTANRPQGRTNCEQIGAHEVGDRDTVAPGAATSAPRLR
jgi:hypothetical protein